QLLSIAIKHDNKFYVFWSRGVVGVLSKNFAAENSQVRDNTQISNQKIIFKLTIKLMDKLK
ncbi:MAG: hypothetical protein QMD06_05185, partial [Candidatus Altarchaeum sp.]|nr:hypothetical protein [Candidatus Altarchaeum sp.]